MYMIDMTLDLSWFVSLHLHNSSYNVTVRMVFEDNHNWDAFRLRHKGELREVEIIQN